MNRIEKLRQIALSHPHAYDEFFYRFYKQYSENRNESDYLKYADAFYCAFSQLTPNISDGELVVGEIKNGLTESEKKEWANTYKEIAEERCRAAGGGQDSHMAIDYELLLSCGLKGIIARIEEYEKSCSPDIAIVRTEPATYQVEEDVWVNPITNEQYNNDTLRKKWSVELAEQFGVGYTPYPRIYRLPHSSIKVDKPCVRNIFAVNFEKFQKFLNENS